MARRASARNLLKGAQRVVGRDGTRGDDVRVRKRDAQCGRAVRGRTHARGHGRPTRGVTPAVARALRRRQGEGQETERTNVHAALQRACSTPWYSDTRASHYPVFKGPATL